MSNYRKMTWINGLKLFGDALILNASVIIAFIIRFKGELPAYNFNDYLIVLPWLTIAAIFMFNFYSLYNTYNKGWTEINASIISSLFMIELMFFMISYFARGFAIPRSVLLLFPIIAFVFLGIWRYGIYRLEHKLMCKNKVVIIGDFDDACKLSDKLDKNKFETIGLIITKANIKNIDSYNVLGTIENTKEILTSIIPDEVYVCSNVNESAKNIILSICFLNTWRVYIVPNLYEILVAQSKLSQVGDTPVFEVGAQVSPGKLQLKRLIDIGLSLIIFIVTLPIIILVAIAIKLDSPGPVFYKQERISEQGKKFKVLKFRTMIENAEKKTGPVLAVNKDPRITRLGRLLRATRIDEIPQIFNVLKGDMSIVGPRPERPFFVEKFVKEIPEYNYRHTLKAGITGLAQVAGKYSTNVEDKLKYDLLYLKAASPIYDLQILLQTIKVLMMKNKAS